MELPAPSLDALIVGKLTDEERDKSVAYLDEQLRPAGQALIGEREYKQGVPYLVAFIDQQPGANWMHPCRYLLIDPASKTTTSINSDRPPRFGTLPPTWRVVWRSQNIEDWRLLPLSRPPSEEKKREDDL